LLASIALHSSGHAHSSTIRLDQTVSSTPRGTIHRARRSPFFEREDLELWATPLGFNVLGRVLATYRFAIVP
jgi:hypothetical protein